ncbi:MAG: hypothetical protein QG653_666 [Patescibacteria group bacterium]|nr:hypothetical protein [Patescibacteria group bacterium]
MTILKCAHIIFCENCGLHGHIVFSDNTQSAEFHFLEEFWRGIAEALVDKKVCSEEVSVLRKELFESAIPSYRFVSRVRSLIDEFFAPDAVEKEMKNCSSGRTLH